MRVTSLSGGFPQGDVDSTYKAPYCKLQDCKHTFMERLLGHSLWVVLN